MTEMVSSATEFVRSGFSEEDAVQLSQVAELYRNVADAEISSAESAQFITSQIKAFNLDANDAITILDQLNSVSNNYAVSSTDIATALSKTSSAMATLGNTSQETIGLVTAGTEQLTGQASKVAKGLRTIGLNIAKTATDRGELNYQLGNTTKNISLLDKSTGDMKSTFQVLSEIAEDWDKMSNAEKTAIGQTLAGKNQYEVFSAVLNQFDDAISATQTALDSQGSAMNENSKYMESIGAKLNALKAQFQELVLGDGGLNSFLKGLIDLGTGILKFANSDVGQVIIKMGALVVAITLAQKAFTSLNATMIASVAGVSKEVAMIAVANGATIGLSGAIDVLTASIMANPLLWGAVAIVGAVGAVTAIIKNYKTEQEKLSEQHEESIKQAKEKIQLYDEEKQKLESLTSQYESNISKINELKNSGNTENNSILKSYELQNGALEKQIEYEQTLLGLANEKAEKEAVGALGEKTQKGYTSSGEEGYVTDSEKIRQNTESIKAFQKSIEDYQIVLNGQQLRTDKVEIYQKSIDDLNKQISDGIIVEDESVKKRKQVWQGLVDGTLTTEQYNDATKTTQDSIKRLIEENSNLIPNVETLNNSIYSTSGANKELKDSNQKIIDSAKEVAGAYGENSGIIEDFTSKESDLEKETNQAKEALEAYKDALSELSSMSDSFTTLNDAIAEYNSSGEFTLDTLSKLLALGDNYLSLLQFENGQLSLNKDGAIALANAKIDEAEASAIQAAEADIAKMSEDGLGDAMADTSAQASASVSGLSSAQTAIRDLGLEASESSLKVNDLYKSLGGKGNVVAGSNAEERTNALANEIKTLESLRKNIGKITISTTHSTSATTHSTSATKGATRATKSQTSAEDKLIKKLNEKKKVLEDLVNNYKTVFSYMKDVVEEEIDKLNEKRDKELSKIDNKRKKLEQTYEKEKTKIEEQMSLLDKEKEEKLDYYDNVISSLNDQKDATEKYYDLEIDKLKKVNEEISYQIKLQEYQESIARAKASKKMVLGESAFEYREDEESVALTTSDLQKFQSEKAREDAIENLENQKEIALESLESQIKYQEYMKASRESYYEDEEKGLQHRLQAIEAFYDEFNTHYDSQEDSINAKYDNLITIKEKYLTKLEKAEKSYERLQAKHLGKILYGKDFENQTNTQRLKNLQAFVSAYNATLSQLGNVTASISSKSSSSSSSSKSSSSSSKSSKKASGDSSIDEDGTYIVGDSPNTELIIGSKLNGVPMNLSKGTGVVNAKSTNTLAGVLNNLSGLGSNFATNNSSNISQYIIIENVNLNNVTDGQSFINEIREFRNNVIQK